MSFLIFVSLFMLLFVIFKWRMMQRFVWIVVALYGCVLLVSPFIYKALMQNSPISYTTAEQESYKKAQQQFFEDLSTGNRIPYEEELIFSKRLPYKEDIFYMNDKREQHQVLFIVEETTDLQHEIEVTMYKRPFLVENIDVSVLYPTPSMTFKKDTLAVNINQQLLYMKGYGVTLFPVSWGSTYKDDNRNNPYIAYLRVPMHTRVLDCYDKRIDQQLLEGGMLDGH